MILKWVIYYLGDKKLDVSSGFFEREVISLSHRKLRTDTYGISPLFYYFIRVWKKIASPVKAWKNWSLSLYLFIILYTQTEE